jgi:predicted trehalose synthase
MTLKEPTDAFGDLAHLIRARQDARRRLDALLAEASAIGARLEQLGHALARRPDRLVFGSASDGLDPRREWETVSDQPLPTIEQLTDLAARVREGKARADELDQRLILTGHPDLIEPSDEFFR